MCIRFVLVSEMIGMILDRGRSFIVMIIVVILSLYTSCSISLTFKILAVTVHTTKFNIKRFHILPRVPLCFSFGSWNKK